MVATFEKITNRPDMNILKPHWRLFVLALTIMLCHASLVNAEVIRYTEPEKIAFERVTKMRQIEITYYKYKTSLEPNMKATESDLRGNVEDALAAYLSATAISNDDWNAEHAAYIQLMMEPGVQERKISKQELAKDLKVQRNGRLRGMKERVSLKRTLLFRFRRGEIYAIFFNLEQSFSDGRHSAYPTILFLKKKNGVWQRLRDKDNDEVVRLRSDIMNIKALGDDYFSKTRYEMVTTPKSKTPRPIRKKFSTNY